MRNDIALPVFNGRSEVWTHCKTDTKANFHDEWMLQLPWAPSDDLNITVEVWDVKIKSDSKLLGTQSIPFVKNGFIQSPKQATGSSQADVSVELSWDVISSIYTTDEPIARLLAGDFGNVGNLTYVSLVPKLPPVLDVVLKAISDGNPAAFNKLLTIIDVFPSNHFDTRYISDYFFEGQMGNNCPLDHLLFYARYCAFRNRAPVTTFFEKFARFWIEHQKTTPVTADRPDLQSIPFLMELVIKCVVIDNHLIVAPSLRDLINKLQNTFRILLETNHDLSESWYLVSRLVGRHLCTFYKDLSNIANKTLVIDLLSAHLQIIADNSSLKFRKTLTRDFLSGCLSPVILVLLCAPCEKGSILSTYLLPLVEIAIADLIVAGELLTKITAVLRCLTPSQVEHLVPSLFSVVTIYANNIKSLSEVVTRDPLDNWIAGDQPNALSNLIIPFSLLLALIARTDVTVLTPNIYPLIARIVLVADREYDLALLGDDNTDEVKMWGRIAFCGQFVTFRLTVQASSFETYNGLIVPTFRAQFSRALKGSMIAAILKFIDKFSDRLYTGDAATYKLVKYLIGTLSQDTFPILQRLWEIETTQLKTNARCTAFIQRGLFRLTHARLQSDPFSNFGMPWRYSDLPPSISHLVKGKAIEPIVAGFKRIWEVIVQLSRDEEANHDDLSDRLVELSDFFSISPDMRVRVLFELGSLHMRQEYLTEAIATMCRCAALIAEILTVQGRDIAGVTSASFTDVCPSALAESGFAGKVRGLFDRTPGVRGICDSGYMTEVGLHVFVYRAVAACCQTRYAKIFEFGRRCLALLSSLTESRGFVELLRREEQESMEMVDGMKTDKSRVLDSFWLVKYETGECFIYHEHGFRKLEKDISHRLTRLASGRKIVITNQGHGLDQAQSKKDVFRVFVKKVEPFMSIDERNSRLTAFERGFNVNQFFNDVPDQKVFKRAIITVQTPFPGITSRVSVKESDIKYVTLTDIEVACVDLENMVFTMSDLMRRKDINGLLGRLKGAILTEVNGGLMNTVQRFLDGSRKEDSHTAEMMVLIRQLFDLLKRGVTLCCNDPGCDPKVDKLPALLDSGLEILKSQCQPYLMG
jgi:hypothetical protein